MSRVISSRVLPGGLDQDFGEEILHVPDLAGLNLDVGGLPARSAHRLIDHDAGVGERETLTLLPCGEEDGRHRSCLTDADGGDRCSHVLHGVEDGEPSRHHAARRVDVELHVFVGVFAF